MKHRSAFEARIDKQANVEKLEREGKISDSTTVRLSLIERLNSGELTVVEMQNELAKIKRDGRKQGLVTRQQAYAAG